MYFQIRKKSVKLLLFLNRKVTLFSALISSVLLIVFVVEELHTKQYIYLKNEVSRQAKEELAIVRAKLEAAIHSDIFIANSLATLITVNPRTTLNEWSPIAEELYRDSNYIRSLGVAPDDVVEYVFPLKGNERAIGLNFKRAPERWPGINMAREIENIFIAGPVALVQGGDAFIVRMPTFLDPPTNRIYWGSVSLVIDNEALFYGTGLYKLKESYQVAVRGRHSLGSEGEVFLGYLDTFVEPTAIETVTLPYGSWQIAIKGQSLESILPWYRINLLRIIGYSFFGLALLSLIVIYRLYVTATRRSLEDELTKLPNRRYFMFTLKTLFLKGHKKGEKFTLLNLDLEKFKAINDTYGHSVGDFVLKEVARRVATVLRSNDIVARVGGDEYLILLPRTFKKQDIHFIMNKVLYSINRKPFLYENCTIHVATSIGYARFNSKMKSVDELLHQADRSMYYNKHK